MKELLQKIYDQHDIVCNQKYNDYLPYSFHLKAVEVQARKYINLIPLEKTSNDGLFSKYFPRKWVVLGAAGHDLIEDARMTYNDVLSLLGVYTANIIYACTECRGHTREEKHCQEFFDTLKENRLGVYVKLCDIMANVLFSLLTSSSMYDKYKKEFPNLKDQLYVEGEYDPLWNDLEKLL